MSGSTPKFIVQAHDGCSKFSSLDYARKHAEMHAPATIWDATAVKVSSSGNWLSTGWAKPLERFNGR